MEGVTPNRGRRLTLLAVFGLTACAVGAAPPPKSPRRPAPKRRPRHRRRQRRPHRLRRPASAAAAEVKLTVLSSGAAQKIGGYNPQQAKLANQKPSAIKKSPEMKAALYGQIPFGGKQYLVALDEPEGEDAKLYVDANGNGDLTDDAAPTWEKKTGQGPNGVQLTQYAGSFQLPLGAGDDPVTLSAYRFDRNDPQRQQLKFTLMYYSDYAYEGQITLGGKPYKAMLTDMAATGQFTSRGGGPKGSGNLLFLDINGDGAFTPRGEILEPAKPFNVKGTTYEMAFPGEAGAPVKLVASKAKVAEVPLPPNHSVGAKITPFKAKRMDGKAVNFPADYKDHLVMLDFWATWCPPCMAELPGLSAAYKQFRPKGVEILGISLDQPNAAAQIKKVTTEHGMTWPQVYDGRYWKAEVAQAYGIDSIPAAFLVDGDTGEILATGGALRGSNLEQTLQAALDKKKAARTGVASSDAKPAEKAEPAAEPAAAEQPAATTPEPAAPPAEKGEKPKDALPF